MKLKQFIEDYSAFALPCTLNIFLIILLLFWLSPVSTLPADTLLVTVKESDGDYSSVAAAIHGEKTDLVAADTVLVVEISGTWSSDDQAGVVINGYTTDSLHQIIIRAIGSSRHSGKWTATNAHRLVTSDPTDSGLYGAIAIFEDCVEVYWMQVIATYDRNSQAVINAGYGSSANARQKYSHNILRLAGEGSTSTGGKGLNFNGSGASVTHMWNNLIYDIPNGALSNDGLGIEAKGRGYIRNNTFVDGGYAIKVHVSWSGATADSLIIQNNLCYNQDYDTVFFYNGPIRHDRSSTDYNSTDAYDLYGVGGSPAGNDRTGQTFTFADAGSDDYHLASGDGGAKDFGADFSSDDSLAFTTDIDNDNRTPTWDIGIDEYIVTAVGQIIIIGSD